MVSNVIVERFASWYIVSTLITPFKKFDDSVFDWSIDLNVMWNHLGLFCA